MKKRIIAIVALAALILGLLAGLIPAVSAAEPTENDRYLVGYSKQDINPWVKSAYTGGLGIADTNYNDSAAHIITIQVTDPKDPTKTISQKMVAVPMAGYSDPLARLSGQMEDDNNDGMIGLGDGLFTTCTAVTDKQGTTLLYITLDALHTYEEFYNVVIPAVSNAVGVPESNIMFSTSHNHEGPEYDYLKWYGKGNVKGVGDYRSWAAYFDYAVNQIVAAAEAAVADQTEAQMYKGEIDAKYATAQLGYNSGAGYQMNTVRHYYMRNGYGELRTFVGGSEFNNFDNKIQSKYDGIVKYNSGNTPYGNVAESNDTMYLLKFAPVDESRDPIVLVNWRAHPSFMGGETANVLSSDYINFLRNYLEKQDYRVAFFQGAAGNINPRDLYRSNSWYRFFPDATSGLERCRIYGELLGEIAKYGLDTAMGQELPGGKIYLKHDIFQVQTDVEGKTISQPLDAIALGEYVVMVVAAGEYFDRYDANYATNYAATGIDPTNPTNITPDVSRYTTNDWNKLVNKETYGTPLFFGYSTAHNKYVPNTMAFDYNTNLTNKTTPTLDDGTTVAFQTFSYEAESYSCSNMKRGQGELIIARMAEMVKEVHEAASNKYAWCEHCGIDAVWKPLRAAFGTEQTLSDGHYYLKQDITGKTVRRKTVSGEVCLDLNGKTLAPSYANGVGVFRGAPFVLNSNATLSVMDIVDDASQTGALVGVGDGDYPGGVVSVFGQNAVFNLYGGDLRYAGNASTVNYGGAVYVKSSATFNMYGGTVQGGSVAGDGGTLYVSSSANANIYGGRLIVGDAKYDGDCVYLESDDSYIRLANDATVDEICFSAKSADTKNLSQLIVSGKYTGKAKITLDDSRVTFSAGMNLGTAENAEIPTEAITYTHTDGEVYEVTVSNGKLKLTSVAPTFMVTDSNGNVIGEYGDFNSAITGYDAGGDTPSTATKHIILLENLTENVTVSKDVYLDLNGKKITGNINIAEGSTLYCMDSYTDDYDVEDGEGYAVITGTVTGDLQGLPEGCPISGNERGEGYTPYYPGYLKIVENGETSFHRVDLGLESINFKPDDLGMSYTCNFSGDQVVARHVKRYGVAISITEAPNADNIGTKSGCSIFTKYQAGDSVNTGKSTRLINIMRQSYKDSLNKQMAELPIYGSAYLLTDEGYVFGTETVKTLREVVEAADAQFSEDVSIELKKNTIWMYQAYESIMSQWNINNIKAVAEKEENRTMKILVVGNSHGVDSTQMLGKIYKTENPDKDVLLGRLYHSGCRLDQHVDYLTNNAGQYIYYKTNADGDWDRIKPTALDAEQSNGDVLNGATMYEALVDEEWDAIIMLTGSRTSGVAATYNEDIQTIQNYINKTLGYTPKYYWHMTWAYPVDDIEGDEFVTVNTSAGFMENYNGDQMTMYNAIVDTVKTKILTDASFSGILPAGTAIQNARTSMMGDPDLFRDHTHLGHYGRLIAAYTWYCALEGVELNSIKLTTVPKSVLKWSGHAAAEDLVLTQQQIDILVESVKNALQNPFEVTQSVYTAQ